LLLKWLTASSLRYFLKAGNGLRLDRTDASRCGGLSKGDDAWGCIFDALSSETRPLGSHRNRTEARRREFAGESRFRLDMFFHTLFLEPLMPLSKQAEPDRGARRRCPFDESLSRARGIGSLGS